MPISFSCIFILLQFLHFVFGLLFNSFYFLPNLFVRIFTFAPRYLVGRVVIILVRLVCILQSFLPQNLDRVDSFLIRLLLLI